VSVSEDIYRELILQHSRHPRHFGDLADATHAADADNPLCGDSYQVRLKVDAGGVIREAAFAGVGCAISKASASLMLDAVIGRTREEFESLFQDFHAVVRGEAPAPEALARLGKLAAFSGIWKYPARVKCAILCWHGVRKALGEAGEAFQSPEN
jgi:nitrogen fixation protein NifU and related proteins